MGRIGTCVDRETLVWMEGHLRGRRDTCVDGGTLAWTDGRLCVPTSNLHAQGK
jgi:hypothetical protein